MTEPVVPVERRQQPFVLDEAKFATQKILSVVLIAIFAGVVTAIFLYSTDLAERSMIIQTVINITMIVVGFWLGSSKGAADTQDRMQKFMQPPPLVVVPPSPPA
jgi:ABC-type enterobactin transport system permease subunit